MPGWSPALGTVRSLEQRRRIEMSNTWMMLMRRYKAVQLPIDFKIIPQGLTSTIAPIEYFNSQNFG